MEDSQPLKYLLFWCSNYNSVGHKIDLSRDDDDGRHQEPFVRYLKIYGFYKDMSAFFEFFVFRFKSYRDTMKHLSLKINFFPNFFKEMHLKKHNRCLWK